MINFFKWKKIFFLTSHDEKCAKYKRTTLLRMYTWNEFFREPKKNWTYISAITTNIRRISTNSNLALEKARKDTGFFKKTTYIKGDHLKNPLILNKSRRKEFTATLVKSSSSWVAGVVTGRWWWHDAGGGVQLSNVAVKWLKLVPQVPLRTIYYAPWPPKHHFGTCTIFLKPLYILLYVCMWNTCRRLVHSTYTYDIPILNMIPYCIN